MPADDGTLRGLLTLIYLAIQIRQNTAALQSASRQTISEGYRASNRLRMDPMAGRAWTKGLSAFPEMPFDERHRFSTIIMRPPLDRSSHPA